MTVDRCHYEEVVNDLSLYERKLEEEEDMEQDVKGLSRFIEAVDTTTHRLFNVDVSYHTSTMVSLLCSFCWCDL